MAEVLTPSHMHKIDENKIHNEKSMKNEPLKKNTLKRKGDEISGREQKVWKCGVCLKRAGNDHRSCVGIAGSISEWKNTRIYEDFKEVSYDPNEWNFKEVSKTTLPPGKYYIGDLCYALDDRLYDHVFGSDYRSGLFYQKNNPKHVFMLNDTGIGDGSFKGTDGYEYSVDAGILGIASFSVLDLKKANYEGGTVVTFKGNVSLNFQPNYKFEYCSDNRTDPKIIISINSEDEDDDCEDEDSEDEDSEDEDSENDDSEY